MKKLKLACSALLMAAASTTWAGGILTNTNQNIAFLRNPARDGAIGIDGVYSNPAGVLFLGQGLHLSFNIQNAHQTRTVDTWFAPFAFGDGNNKQSQKKFKGTADAPILPSLQAAYNTEKWSFQFGFAVTGGGGKCEFEHGLPSFESTVSMLPMLSQNMDPLTNKIGLGTLGLPTVSQYKMDTYMRGRQYYFGFTLGAAYKLTDNLSVYGGLRALYGSANYYGYVRDIQANIGGQFVPASQTFQSGAAQAFEGVGQATAAAQMAQEAGNIELAQQYAGAAHEAAIKGTMLSALGQATQDVTMNCDQTGLGVAPILGIDYKTGAFNFAAKYEFKTRMRLKNKSANSESAKNLAMLDKFADGKKVAEDSPALLTVGARWEALPGLRVNAGWHHYFDKAATQYGNHQKKLDGDTNEYLFGAEYDVNKRLEVSAGMQLTRYQMTDDYMQDLSFNVNSYTFGFGVGIHLSEKVKLNVAYFQTNYEDYNRTTQDYNNLSSMASTIIGGVSQGLGIDEATTANAIQTTQAMLTTPGADGKSALYGTDSFTRTNRVLGIGIDLKF